MEKKVLEVRTGIAFAARTVLVIRPSGRKAIGPFADVLQQAGFVIVNKEGGV